MSLPDPTNKGEDHSRSLRKSILTYTKAANMESNGVMTSARHKISRRRPANSCEACRRRKIRCDQGLPCGSCVRARSALLCSYRDNLGARGPARRGSSSSNSNSNSNSRANGGGAGSGGSNGNGNGNGTERGGASPSEATPQLLTPPSPTLSGTELLRECLPDLDAPRGRGQQGLAADMAQNTASASASASKPDKGSHLADKPPVPRLRQVPEKTKFFPQHHWALVSDRVRSHPCITTPMAGC
jgi:hypothetical protein